MHPEFLEINKFKSNKEKKKYIKKKYLKLKKVACGLKENKLLTTVAHQ